MRHRARIFLVLLPVVAGLAASSCGSGDEAVGSSLEEIRGGPASKVFSKVAITTLPGASPNAGALATFDRDRLRGGHTTAPSLSNSQLSAVPGAPAKPLFVGQAQPFDNVLIAVRGRAGHFVVPAGSNATVGLDLVPALTGVSGQLTLFVATQTGSEISEITAVSLLVDKRVHISAGDLTNHDTAVSTIADLFGVFLEGKQGGATPVPAQVLDSHDNNSDITNGVKGLDGPVASGHREILWDNVPQKFLNLPNFDAQFFNRLDTGTLGVRGGAIFQPVNGTGEEVNNAFTGVVTGLAADGTAATLGGDFSNVNPKFAGSDVLSFTQLAQFSPLGTVTTDVIFRVAGSGARAVVTGCGVVFTSVDNRNSSSVEFLDEHGERIARIFAPPQSHGPFPFPGPLAANKFPYSFVGFIDPTARIARMRVTAGEVPIDQATADLPDQGQDVAAFDDTYYAEPHP